MATIRRSRTSKARDLLPEADSTGVVRHDGCRATVIERSSTSGLEGTPPAHEASAGTRRIGLGRLLPAELLELADTGWDA